MNSNIISRTFSRFFLRITSYRYKKIGKHSCIYKPLQIDNPKGISIGQNVFVAHQAWLMGSGNDNDKGLVIGDNTVIGHFAHIVAMREVEIENNVLMADRVFVTDCTHDYGNALIPIINQGVSFLKSVKIGEGSWLGENVCVLGSSVGKHCVIGSNSVVTSDIPDYSVAVGIPAKVVKKFDFELDEWILV